MLFIVMRWMARTGCNTYTDNIMGRSLDKEKIEKTKKELDIIAIIN